jgi:hypothetical protein
MFRIKWTKITWFGMENNGIEKVILTKIKQR